MVWIVLKKQGVKTLIKKGSRLREKLKKVGSENWNHYFLLFKIKSGGKKNG